jgi:hypothetical protein
MSAKRKLVNVVVGRFVPFTIGHFQMGKDLVAENGYPVVYIYIRSKSGENSYLSDSLIERYMADVVKKYSHIEDAFSMTGSFIPVVIMELQRRGYEPVLLGAGPDRVSTYEGMVKRMKNIDVVDGFGIFPLMTRITSATEVRAAIKEDDYNKFKKLTPAVIHKYYKEIQEELLNKKAVMENNTEDMNEARLPKLKFKPYKEYHPSYASTLDTISDYVEDNGYFFNKEDFFNAFGDAFFKPRKGATQSKTITIYKDKATTDAIGNLHISIYNRGTDGNTFELIMYHDQIGVLKEAVSIQRKDIINSIDEILTNSNNIKEEIYKLIEELFGENGIEVFETLTEANNEAIKKSQNRLIEIAWSLKNREISENELPAEDKDAIVKLSKMPSDFFKKLKETLTSIPFHSVNEMEGHNMDYLQKINIATMMLMKTNRPFSFEDYCTCMKRSHYIKKEFIPFLIMQGLSDYQIERFMDNLFRVSYFHYTNYFLGHSGRQYTRSIAAVQESVEVNEMKDGVDYKTKDVHISDIKQGDTVMYKNKMMTVGKKDIKNNSGDWTLFGDSYKAGKDKVTLVLFKRDWDKLKESEEVVNKKNTILEDMKRLDEIKAELNESTDATIQKVVKVVEDAIKQGKTLMSMRGALESIFKKKDIDFSFSPQAHFMIKDKNKKIVIINKAYVDDADATVGDYAIGYI